MKWINNQPKFQPRKIWLQLINDKPAYFTKPNKNYQILNEIDNPFKTYCDIIINYYHPKNMMNRYCNHVRNKVRAKRVDYLLNTNLTIDSLLYYFENPNDYFITNWDIEERNGKNCCSIEGYHYVY